MDEPFSSSPLPLVDEPFDHLAPLLADLHLGGERVATVLEQRLSFRVLNLNHDLSNPKRNIDDLSIQALRALSQADKAEK